jgi:threonylcarbamoyladenosine tRNA methylthiotransferase MtaB
MPGVVPVPERHQRSKMLRILSDKKRRFFYVQYVGQERPVLFEGKEASGEMNGFTDNYVKVVTSVKPELINELCTVNLQSVNPDGLMEIESKVLSLS